MPHTAAVQVDQSMRRFDMAVDVNGLVEIKLPVRPPAQRMDHMMRVFSSESRQNNSFLIRLAITINIFEMQQFSALPNITSAVPRDYGRWNKQSVRKNSRFFGEAVTV